MGFWEAVLRPEVIAPFMVFSIPLAAIIGSFYYKIQKMKLEKGGGGSSMTDEERLLVKRLINDNVEMRDRVENLEAIITSLDKELLQFKALNDSEATKKYVADLADQMQAKE
jgi:hypothetical protein